MDAYSISIAKQALYLVLLLTAPPVLGALLVGLTISILQATTQVQEQTLTFVPKMVVIFSIIAFLGPLGMAYLINFAKTLFDGFPHYIQ